MVYKNKKKAEATYYLVGIILGVVSFFIILMFLTQTQEFVASSQQDLACRASLALDDSEVVGNVVEFLVNIDDRCQVDYVEVDNQDKNSTLQEVAEAKERCWFRYGEGELDFLSNWDSEGQWCFKCGTLDFQDDEGEVISYLEFFDWMGENEVQVYGEEGMTFQEYLNVMGVSDGDEQELIPRFEDDYGDDEMDILEYRAQMGILDALRNNLYKEINPQEDLYVVFKYTRVDQETADQLAEAAKGAGMAGGTIAGAKILTSPRESTVSAVRGTGEAMRNMGNLRNAGAREFSAAARNMGGKAARTVARHPISALAIGSASYYFAHTNPNYVQYVEIMDKEEYYRECGTMPFSEEELR